MATGFTTVQNDGRTVKLEDLLVRRDQFSGGQVWGWGGGDYGQLGNNSTSRYSSPTTTILGYNWKQLSSGNYHTAGIKTDGTLWTCGYNRHGELGDGTIVSKTSPVTTTLGTTSTWAWVSCGYKYTAAIKSDGTLWTCGYNRLGQLGNGQSLVSVTSILGTTAGGGTNWSRVSAGNSHTLGLKTDGTLWSWGYNGYGQLGWNVTTGQTGVPATTIGGGTTWLQGSSALFHTAAVKTDGTLWTWGYDNYGQLGNGSAFSSGVFSPITTAGGGTTWSQVACGYYSTLAVKSDGTLWGFGQVTGTSSPVTVLGAGTGWKKVATFYSCYAAIKTDGTLWTWGQNTVGQLGDGTIVSKTSPVSVIGGGTWKDIAVGQQYMAAIKTDGTLWSWGNNNSGQLGTGDTVNYSSPMSIASGGTWTSVAAGLTTSVGVQSNGTLWLWGADYFIANSYFPRSSPIAVMPAGTDWVQVGGAGTTFHAVKTNGTLWSLGSNYYGQLGIGTSTNFVTSGTAYIVTGTNWSTTTNFSSGRYTQVAVRTDGTLWTWGDNTNGQLGTPELYNLGSPALVTTSTQWSQISAGGNVSAGIKTDGTLWTWGYNGYGSLGTGDNSNYSSPVTTFGGGFWQSTSAGGNHMGGIKTDGTLWMWGYDYYGQLGDNSATYTSSTSPVTTAGAGANWKSLSCAVESTAAIKTDGTLWTWGYNLNYGELGNGTTTITASPATVVGQLANWKSVTCGSHFMLGIQDLSL